ncbi:TetR/AcrR family transcriptional regulator [Rhodococcus sp. BGS-1C]|uniref:TetR/AcrR family transcriptional regulator n=1 Tax=unclassified Rhodococcus (in: high G+C Gram-positive bacteria) TaxID=192944 RepID=UPI0019D13A28|nr:TetR/AcrR family transcriptional regulator [Rhodococcus sp. KRD197]
MTTSPRRGRLPTRERDARRAEILSAAAAELVEVGTQGLTMAAVAARAGASKETLYAWFGGRDELLGALIEANADHSMAAISELFDHGDLDDLDRVRELLGSFARGLLTLLTGRVSIELNRAAATSPELAQRLLASGRYRVGPRAEAFFAELHTRGILNVPDPADAFCTFYGLTIRDTQIRLLLGEPAPTADAIAATADQAVTQFILLNQ